MAYLTYETATQTTIGRWRIVNLQYPANQYDGFRICLFTSYSAASNSSDGSSGWHQRITFTSSSTSTSTFWTPNSFGAGAFSPLSCGTWYYIRGFARWAGVWYRVGGSGGIVSVQTSSCGTLSTPNLHTLNSGTDNIYVRCTTVANANQYEFNRGSVYASTSNPWWTFTGLSPDTEYFVRFRAKDTSGKYNSSSWSSWYQIRTDPLIPRPSNWSWTSAETTAFNNQGTTVTLTASRWNSFLSRIDAFCDYKGVSRLPSYVYRTSGSVLYASDFRVVSNKIHSMSGNVAWECRNAQSQTTVFGWFFPHLATALNSIS